MTEYESCYVFNPGDTNAHTQRPSKKRKVDRTNETGVQEFEHTFVPLLRGLEERENANARLKAFVNKWHQKENLIDQIVYNANADIAGEVASFVSNSDLENGSGRLPAALIVVGPDTRLSANLLQSVSQKLSPDEHLILINLTSGQCPNLKTALKCINQSAVKHDLSGEDDEITNQSLGGRHLNYDLQSLRDYVDTYSISKVMLSFEDSEAFEGRVLSDLIDILSCWNDRIPFVLLFNIATSVELFQEKLSSAAIKQLEGAAFHVEEVSVEEVFKSLHCDHTKLYLGATLSRAILQQQKHYIQSSFALTQNLRYAYMTHFFANPLSILLESDGTLPPLQKEHFEAVRNLPSFKLYAEGSLRVGNYGRVRSLLDDDEFLNEVIFQQIEYDRRALQGLIASVETLSKMQSKLSLKSPVPWTEMYIHAMSGELLESPCMEDTISALKKLPSNGMVNLLDSLTQMPIMVHLKTSKANLNQLTSQLDDPQTILRSQYDIHHESLRTTIVAQKVSLSKNTSALSAHDIRYSKLVDSIHATFKVYFQRTLIDPHTLFLHEILIYDSKSPHREVFTPRPRFAVERALSSPHDYLGCECCSGEVKGLSATQPATAVLYQLYLESGSLINTADLWQAFWTVVGDDGVEDEEGERVRVLALFSRALAELKYMGMIKNSRKKADHLAKLSWKGL